MDANSNTTRRKTKWKKILWISGLVMAIPFLCISALMVILGMVKKPEVSNDVTALRAVINLPEQVTSARWEIFFTPENNGWVSGPTDYVSLIAELKTEDEGWLASQDTPARYPGIVFEAARPWLSNWSRSIVEKYKGSKGKITSEPGCRLYQGQMKESGRKVYGFLCSHGRQTLLYLILSRPPEEEMLLNQNEAQQTPG